MTFCWNFTMIISNMNHFQVYYATFSHLELPEQIPGINIENFRRTFIHFYSIFVHQIQLTFILLQFFEVQFSKISETLLFDTCKITFMHI